MVDIEDIAKLLSEIDDPSLIRNFLNQLLTKAEVERICKRWELVQLLHKGYSQREIAERLGLSLCNITRGSRELKKANSAFMKILKMEDEKNE
ncbi:MAG: Trp family transcriptional regulator [Spirochaetia bacterium]